MNTNKANLPKRVLLVSGVNLGILGTREPQIYGSETLADHVGRAEAEAKTVGLELRHIQSNHEGDLVDAILNARHDCQAIVINPGAYTHYAWSLHDALAAFPGPVIEVHLSNPAAREPWRHQSVIAPVASGTIAGLGGLGYQLAIRAVAQLLAE